MEDAIKSIKAYLYDRESSPLIGAYFISWCIWNFKFLLIIFSSDPTKTKFINIESYLFEPSYFFGYSQWIGPIWVYFIPLMLALAYLIVLPKFSIKIYEISLHNRKQLNETRQKIEDQELLTKEESIKIRREIYKVSDEYEAELKNKDELIAELKDKLASTTNKDPSNSDDTTESQKVLEELSNKSKELLKMASLADGTIATLNTMDGFSFAIANKRIKPTNAREEALFKQAIADLQTSDLITSKNLDGTLFGLTVLGYEVADLITQAGVSHEH